jgi:hypothetical protein
VDKLGCSGRGWVFGLAKLVAGVTSKHILEGGIIMKKCFVLALVWVALLFLFPIAGKAQMGPQMGPWMMGYGYGMGPGMMHGYGMGPGMMGGYGGGYCPYYGRGYGYGMGPGMMGPGYGYGYGYGPQYQQPQKPLDENQAKESVENYLKSTRNPNLMLGKITERGAYYEAEIVTKDNSLVDKILVDRYTGWMRSEY